eukprot:s1844_g16.t1
MTAALTLAALTVFAQYWGGAHWRRPAEEPEEEGGAVEWVFEMPNLYLATRVLRLLPNVVCALGDRLVEEEAWYELQDVLVHGHLLQLLFSADVPARWFRFARDRTQETEVLGQLAFPGGWQVTVLVHVCWDAREEVEEDGPPEEGGEEEEQEFAPELDLESLFGSEHPSLDNLVVEEVGLESFGWLGTPLLGQLGRRRG